MAWPSSIFCIVIELHTNTHTPFLDFLSTPKRHTVLFDLKQTKCATRVYFRQKPKENLKPAIDIYQMVSRIVPWPYNNYTYNKTKKNFCFVFIFQKSEL